MLRNASIIGFKQVFKLLQSIHAETDDEQNPYKGRHRGDNL